MLRILLAAAALTAVATLAPHPASANGHAPWCAVVDIGDENVVSYCSYWSFRECMPFILAGNRGFCEPNPNFRGQAERPYRRSYRHR